MDRKKVTKAACIVSVSSVLFLSTYLAGENFCLKDALSKANKSNVELKRSISSLNAEKAVLTRKLNLMENSRSQCSLDTLARKNNNPFNVKVLEKGLWKGQIGRDKHGHAVFSTEEYGIRAGAFVLKNYSRKHKIDTIDALVDRFCVGNTDEYKRFLSKSLGLKIDEKFSLIKRMPELMRAMYKFESGEEAPEKFIAMFDVVKSF